MRRWPLHDTRPQARVIRSRATPSQRGSSRFAAGLVVAAVLPETEKERELARSMQPRLESAASEVGVVAQDSAEALKPAAQEAAEHMKEQAHQSGETLKEDAKSSAQSVRNS